MGIKALQFPPPVGADDVDIAEREEENDGIRGRAILDPGGQDSPAQKGQNPEEKRCGEFWVDSNQAAEPAQCAEDQVNVGQLTLYPHWHMGSDVGLYRKERGLFNLDYSRCVLQLITFRAPWGSLGG